MLIYPTDDNVYLSKGNWTLQGNEATCYNLGANLNFTTDAFTKGNKSITLNFEIPNPKENVAPVIAWRIGPLNWQYAFVSEKVTISLPEAYDDTTENPVMSGLSDHYIEIWVRCTPFGSYKWTWDDHVNNNIIILKSIEIADDASLLTTTQPETTMLVLGDSFTEGYGTIGKEHVSTLSNSTMEGWGALLGKALGFNVSTSAYGGTGFFNTNNNSVPTFDITYKYLDNGILRDFSGIDILAVCIGANDGAATTDQFVEKCSAMIDDLRSRYPKMTLLFANPFWGTQEKAYDVISKNYANDEKVHYIKTIYSQLSGHHPTLTNYYQYMLSDIISKAKKALFFTKDNTQEIVYVQQKGNENITIKSSNPFEIIKIRKVN